MKASQLAGAAALAAWLAAGNAWADGHYTPGVEGLQAASVPAPGMYYLGYLVNYDIDRLPRAGQQRNLPGRTTGHRHGAGQPLSSGSRATSCWAPTTAWRPSCR
jgi:hypothetical protein